jgi:hypothetical protein
MGCEVALTSLRCVQGWSPKVGSAPGATNENRAVSRLTTHPEPMDFSLKGMCILMAVSTPSVDRALRPSLVIAEALVDRQDPSQIQARARKLGLSPVLTETVVSVCCGKQQIPASTTRGDSVDTHCS